VARAKVAARESKPFQRYRLSTKLHVGRKRFAAKLGELQAAVMTFREMLFPSAGLPHQPSPHDVAIIVAIARMVA